MQKWEYQHTPLQQTDLARMGLDGWRLVSVDAGIAYFERPIEEQEPESDADEAGVDEAATPRARRK